VVEEDRATTSVTARQSRDKMLPTTPAPPRVPASGNGQARTFVSAGRSLAAPPPRLPATDEEEATSSSPIARLFALRSISMNNPRQRAPAPIQVAVPEFTDLSSRVYHLSRWQ
jgi:hypothetical protein